MDLPTVYVEIFALYIFSRYSRFSNIRRNIYNLQISYIMPHGENIIKNVNLSLGKLPIFVNSGKFIHAKISTFSVLLLPSCMMSPIPLQLDSNEVSTTSKPAH